MKRIIFPSMAFGMFVFLSSAPVFADTADFHVQYRETQSTESYQSSNTDGSVTYTSVTTGQQVAQGTGQARDSGGSSSSPRSSTTSNPSSQSQSTPGSSSNSSSVTPGTNIPGGWNDQPGGSYGGIGGSYGGNGSGPGEEFLDGMTAFNQLPSTNQSDYWNVTNPDTIRYIPSDSVPGASQLNQTQTPGKQTETPVDSMTTSNGLEIRNYTPLFWDWKFQNVTDGNLITKMQQPLHSINQYFGDPGHWYVYYHEYARWETGYWDDAGNGGRVWVHVSWEEGYLYNWRYLTDFYLSEWEIRKTWTVPSGVQEHRLDVETVQQVAK